MQFRVADQGCGLDAERPDGIRLKLPAEGREHPPVPPLGQPDHRFRPCIVVFIGEPFGESVSKLRRVHVHLRPQRKGRPITDMGCRVSRQFDEDAEGLFLFVTRQCEDDAVSNVWVGMATEPRRRNDGFGISEVRQGDKDRLEDIVILLAFQHAQEGVEARLGEGAIGDSELPEDIRPHTALHRT